MLSRIVLIKLNKLRHFEIFLRLSGVDFYNNYSYNAMCKYKYYYS